MDYTNIILEMLNRIQVLEKEVAFLRENMTSQQTVGSKNHGNRHPSHEKHNDTTTSKRDTSRYLWNGNVYLKNRLVLAIVTDYVDQHPNITSTELKKTFDKSLQGSIGVVEIESVVFQRHDYEIRYFAKDSERIRVSDGYVYVCSQWGVLNISNFIARATQLGYLINKI